MAEFFLKLFPGKGDIYRMPKKGGEDDKKAWKFSQVHFLLLALISLFKKMFRLVSGLIFTSVVDPEPDPDPQGSGTFAGSGT
jgi:hypothetical protein